MPYAVVIGAGHAGCEAALALSRLGIETLLITLNLESIALLPCNPSIGGTGKGQLVREIDALGGEMGLAIDDCTLQSRMLNTGKGPAVHSLRAQADKRAYQVRMQNALFSQEHLTIRQGEANEILVENGRIAGIITATGDRINCDALVIASGVYLQSRIIIGPAHWNSGPQGLMNAQNLSASLERLGFQLRRFKTGTPARIDERSIDFEQMEIQEGDKEIIPFSTLTTHPIPNLKPCYLTWTNESTHQIIRDNLHRSPMYSGDIKGTGARYCPSIEDKIKRFADKDRHQVFVEPEGLHTHEWYIQGMSSSLPEDVQRQMYRTLPGLRRAVLTRLAYAIEYDCIDPTLLRPSLESRDIPGLFFAGQINGTSGYEEAAAQGLIAGINAALALKGEAPFLLSRTEAYIGVMLDDLSHKGTDEPYRMMTGRVEYRLSIRQDNADLRLTSRGYALGLSGEKRMRLAEQKEKETDQILTCLQENKQLEGIRRGDLKLAELPCTRDFSKDAVSQAEIRLRYEGYLQKEQSQVREIRALESHLFPVNIDYQSIQSLRIEARQKLMNKRPRSLGEASQIPGVNPADIAVLSIWLKRFEEGKQPQ